MRYARFGSRIPDPVFRGTPLNAAADSASAVRRLPHQHVARAPVAEGRVGRDRLPDDARRVRRLRRGRARDARVRRRPADGVHLDRVGRPPDSVRAPGRSPVGTDDPGRDRDRFADSHLLDSVHARRERRRVRALLLVPEPVRGVHARAGAGLDVPGHVRRLGGRRPLLLPPDWFLVPQAVGGRRREESVRRQSHRRLRVPPRDVPAVLEVRHARLPAAGVAGLAPRARNGHGDRHDRDVAALPRCHRQVGPDSALRLAARTRWKAPRRSPR